MAFKYKIRRIPRKPLPAGNIQQEGPEEILSGYIRGAEASDIEERFARALEAVRHVDNYEFRMPVISGRGLPGQLEIDFVVTLGALVYPFQIDGEYAHKGISKRMDDNRKDVLVNQYMQRYGAKPVMRIDGEKLQTQEMADQLVKELIL